MTMKNDVNQKFCWVKEGNFFYRWVRTSGGVILVIPTLFKAKKSIL